MLKQVALTTEDNPFSPFTDFDRWWEFDEQNGYHSCAYLARILKIDSSMSEEEQFEAKEEAIDAILSFNLTGNYKKVYSNNATPMA